MEPEAPVLSVTSPVSPALERVRAVLFAPFDFAKWLKLGFCAFLAGLLEGGGGGFDFSGDSWGGGEGGNRVREELDHAGAWLQENLSTAILVATLVLLAATAIGLLLIWLRSRGRFMFLDGVVHDRGAVARPWGEFRREANSLFRFDAVLVLATLFASALAAAIGLAFAWGDIQAERFDTGAVLGLVTFVGLILLVSLTAVLVTLIVRDFVVPAMYARRLSVLEAWAVVRDEVLAPRVGTIVLYVLMKALIAVAMGALALVAGIATCCIGFCLMVIPYVGSVVLLPLSVFERSFSLYFLEQLGGPWKLVEPLQEPPGEASMPPDAAPW